MRAIRLHAFGSSSGLVVEEIQTPTPDENELLVRISAASINASDIKNVQGLMHQTTLPRTPGRDFAGTVVAGRTDMIGKQVWGTGGDLGFTRDGSHADYLVIPADAAVLLPANISPQAAACCGVTFATATYGLREAAIGAGQTIAVIGVFGGVGRAAAQVAKLLGAKVIGVARSAPPADLPASFKDIFLIDSSKQDVAAIIRQITEGRGADIVYDTVGGTMLLEGLKYLANRGRIIEISAGHDPKVTINLRDFYHQQARLVGVDSLSLDAVASASILRGLIQGFETGELIAPPIAATYPLEDAVRAYQAVESGKGEGRHILVLKPSVKNEGSG
jgi:NADPH:quinone reductase